MAVFQLKTFKDIQDAVLEEVKVLSTDTNALNRIKRDINMVYMNEIVPMERWKWLRAHTDLNVPVMITTGTIAATQNSRAITFSSAPTNSVKGYIFSVDGRSEVYRISEHTAGATGAVLESEYVSATVTAAGYSVWLDELALPSECRETIDVWHDINQTTLEGFGIQKYRQLALQSPKEESLPRIYSTTDWVDPDPYSTISGLPALSTRASAGLVRTLVFASDVSSLVSVNDRIEVTASDDAQYNGKWVISSVSTATITYTATTRLTETATADSNLTMKALSQETNTERYRKLLIHPSRTTEQYQLHIDYIKEVRPLEDDTDEPEIPIEDRMVIVYGALHRAWSRERNPEEAVRNEQLFSRKLASMRGKLDDSTDHVRLRPSQAYLANKRGRGFTWFDWRKYD